jgi:AcrR family transcriptional regulator
MKKDTKQEIMEATIRLIEEKGSTIAGITVRDICARAGVGISQINYHFQTKDNLIAQCVQKLIGSIIGTFGGIASALPPMSAMERLKTMLLANCRFIYTRENISRISILTDHQSPHADDNTAQTIDVYLPLVADVCRERGISDDPRMLTTLIVHAVQTLFLRDEVIKKEVQIDLRSEAAREKLIGGWLDRIFYTGEIK